MNENINLYEILKDTPKGTKFWSPTFGDLYLQDISPIKIIFSNTNVLNKPHNLLQFTSNGTYYYAFNNAECSVFPSKDQRDWNKYQRPFKDGDIVYGENFCCYYITIYKSDKDKDSFNYYASVNSQEIFRINRNAAKENLRFASEEEKQELFRAIKDNGYKWNSETKTLEKLITPNFKVGDIIWDKDYYKVKITNVNIEDRFYTYESLIAKRIGTITFNDQYDLELVEYRVGDHFIDPKNNNVFVITKIENNGNYNIESLGGLCYIFEMRKTDIDKYTKIHHWAPEWLKPFDKVLIRDSSCDSWVAVSFSHIDDTKEFPYVTSYAKSRYCIPYNSETEHLVGTTSEEPEFYKL